MLRAVGVTVHFAGCLSAAWLVALLVRELSGRWLRWAVLALSTPLLAFVAFGSWGLYFASLRSPGPLESLTLWGVLLVSCAHHLATDPVLLGLSSLAAAPVLFLADAFHRGFPRRQVAWLATCVAGVVLLLALVTPLAGGTTLLMLPVGCVFVPEVTNAFPVLAVGLKHPGTDVVRLLVMFSAPAIVLWVKAAEANARRPDD